MLIVCFNDTDTLIFDGKLDGVLPSGTVIKASISNRRGQTVGDFVVLAITHNNNKSTFRLSHAPLSAGQYYANVVFVKGGFVSSSEVFMMVINKSPTGIL